MCSVARNFSKLSNCRLVLALVRSMTSSAEQLTSEATPGRAVSTFGGAQAVTVAASMVGKSAARLAETVPETRAPPGAAAVAVMAFDDGSARYANPCLAI